MGAQYNDTLFRQQFPEFTDTTKYPVPLLTMYFNVGTEWIDPNSIDILQADSLQYALNLMTAHILWLGMNVAGANGGTGGIGQQGGFETGASIDKISVQKLAPPLEAGDMYGYWLAQSPYGQALAAFLAMKAAGGVFIGGMPESSGFRRFGGAFY